MKLNEVIEKLNSMSYKELTNHLDMLKNKISTHIVNESSTSVNNHLLELKQEYNLTKRLLNQHKHTPINTKDVDWWD